MKLLQELLQLNEGKVKSSLLPQHDEPEMSVLKKMKYILKTKHGYSNDDFEGLSFADIESIFLDDAGEPDFRANEGKEKKHYIKSNGSNIAGPFDSEDEAEKYLDKLLRRAKPEDELDDAHIVTEAKNHMGETEYSSYVSWKTALKKTFPEYWIDGDKEIANAMIGPKPYKRGETKSVGEWDGETGVIYQLTEAKRYSSHGYWAADAKELGYRVKKVSGDLMKGNLTWQAFKDQKKVGEFTEKEENRGGWLNEAKMKTIKVKEPGWYVVDHMERAVEGPMQERGAKERAEELSGDVGDGDIPAFDASYFTDYVIRRMNEK